MCVINIMAHNAWNAWNGLGCFLVKVVGDDEIFIGWKLAEDFDDVLFPC